MLEPRDAVERILKGAALIFCFHTEPSVPLLPKMLGSWQVGIW
jgi:hypothetical protein